MDLKSKIILISGPTASGKTNFAVKLAKKINGEIINADSMQVYKELKILTARPSKNEQKNIKHHLYGFQSVKKIFSTGSWLKLAIKKIKEGISSGLIVAKKQTRGRGRYGNKWIYLKNNLFMSVFFNLGNNISLKKLTSTSCKIIKGTAPL